MSRRYPNSTAQLGTYRTGAPDYVEVPSSLSAMTGRDKFTARAAKDEWVTGDTLGLRIEKNNFNFVLWRATWDEENSCLHRVTGYDATGSITNGDVVTVKAVLLEQELLDALFNLENPDGVVSAKSFIASGAVFTPTDATTVLINTESLNGATVCLTAASSVNVYLSNLSSGFHIIFQRETASSVTIYAPSGGTINGAASVTMPAQWSGAYLYTRSPGVWVANI